MFGKGMDTIASNFIKTGKETQAQIKALEDRIATLTSAYDALFDVVIQELGYVPAQEPRYLPDPNSTSGWTIGVRPKTPREFAKTSPAAEFVRTKKARAA